MRNTVSLSYLAQSMLCYTAISLKKKRPILTKIAHFGPHLCPSKVLICRVACVVCPVCSDGVCRVLSSWKGWHCIVSFPLRTGNQSTELNCLPVCCLLFFFPSYIYIFFYPTIICQEGNHQHQLLLSQDAFRCVTSDKQAIIRNSLLWITRLQGSCPTAYSCTQP